MMKIHTVAAGGGSVLHFSDGRMQVGPMSAGANPGPACYRRGGPLTVTDINVLLGRIQPEHFPRVFGPGGDQPLDSDAVKNGFAELTDRINAEAATWLKSEIARLTDYPADLQSHSWRPRIGWNRVWQRI